MHNSQSDCWHVQATFRGIFEFHMMASCEPRRSSAYSEDLRWRMVWQSEALGCSYSTIARNLNVDKSTVCRTIQLFYSTGTVSKRDYPKDSAPRKLSNPAQLFILHLVIRQPGIYLHEMQRELSDFLGIEVSISTIFRFLHENGFTRQKLQITAIQRDEFLRQQYVSDISIYNPEMLVFLDETGADCRNAMRKYGYSLRGMPLVSHQLLVRGERVSALAIISVNGLLDVKVVRGTTNGDTFYDFIQENLLPHLMPFNGENPHSVVIMDNCSIHHIDEIVSMIQDVGAIVHFLPPYSPDFMPIELAFSKVKTTLKTLDWDMKDITDVETILLTAFTAITPENCCAWISASGLYY